MLSWRRTNEQSLFRTQDGSEDWWWGLIYCCALRCSLVTKEPHRERWICEQIDKGWECDWMDVTRSLCEGSLFVREVSVSVNSHISISRFHWSLVAAPTHSLHSFRCRARLIRFFPRFFYDSALIAFNLCEFYLMSLLSTVRLFTTALLSRCFCF